MDKNYLTNEEKEILEQFENNTSSTAKNVTDEKNTAISAADHLIKKVSVLILG